MTTLNIKELLEERRRPFVDAYASPKSELAAVARDLKPISFVAEWHRSTIVDPGGPFAELTSEALSLGLNVICQPVTDPVLGDSVCVFAFKEPNSWRVAAYGCLREMMRTFTWSDGAEFVLSKVLGYTDEQINDWIAFERYRRCGWIGRTVHLLMSHEQTAMMRAVGCRCIAPDTLNSELILFVPNGFNVIKSNGAEIVADQGYSIARVAMMRSFIDKRFGSPGTWTDEAVVSTNLYGTDPCEVNDALESRVEFLRNGIWE